MSNNSSDYQNAIVDHVGGKLERKHRIMACDHTHPQMVALDAFLAANVSAYIGRDSDVLVAKFRYHIDQPDNFDMWLEKMRKKQRLHDGDRTHPQLVALDAFIASSPLYPGRAADVRDAEFRYHVGQPNSFDSWLERMGKKMRLFSGDRTHPQLVALDAILSSGASYPGRAADVTEAEARYHLDWPDVFDFWLETMSKKQRLHCGDRTHPQLVTLDALLASSPTYVGREIDVAEAEVRHCRDSPHVFEHWLGKIDKTSRLHSGDRTHPQLVALDTLIASVPPYPGRAEDVSEAEAIYKLNWPIAFDVWLDKIKHKTRCVIDTER